MTVADRVLTILRTSGAILDGHFQLASGLHSNVYFQIGRLFSNPAQAVEIAGLLSDPFRNSKLDAVVGMEAAGSVLAFEVGRLLDVPVIIGRRDGQGLRMFGDPTWTNSTKVLIVDDVLTTGGTIKLMQDWVLRSAGLVAGVTLVLSKGPPKIRLSDRQSILLEHPEVPLYKPEECPLCQSAVALAAM